MKCNLLSVFFEAFLKLLRFFRGKHLRSSIKKGILKIQQNPQGNTCAGVSILINLHASVLHLYQKKRLRHRFFLVNSVKFLRTVFFSDYLRATASVLVCDSSVFVCDSSVVLVMTVKSGYI